MSTKQQSLPIERLSVVTLVVTDQDDAVEWYRDALGFVVKSDTSFEMEGAHGRWLTIAPPGNEEIEIALVEPDPELYDEESLDVLNEMLGSDPWWTFTTEDLDATLATLDDRDVEIVGDIRDVEWGRFAMIRDPFGNNLQLYEPAPMPTDDD